MLGLKLFRVSKKGPRGGGGGGGGAYICVGKLTVTGSDNGLSPGRRQAVIWTYAEILLIGLLGTKFSEILIIEIETFPLKKLGLKVSSGKWRPFCLGLNVLKTVFSRLMPHMRTSGNHLNVNSACPCIWILNVKTRQLWNRFIFMLEIDIVISWQECIFVSKWYCGSFEFIKTTHIIFINGKPE